MLTAPFTKLFPVPTDCLITHPLCTDLNGGFWSCLKKKKKKCTGTGQSVILETLCCPYPHQVLDEYPPLLRK